MENLRDSASSYGHKTWLRRNKRTSKHCTEKEKTLKMTANVLAWTNGRKTVSVTKTSWKTDRRGRRKAREVFRFRSAKFEVIVEHQLVFCKQLKIVTVQIILINFIFISRLEVND